MAKKEKLKDEPVLTLNFAETEADDDWLRVARLQKAAKKGDKSAAELKRMQSSFMTEINERE